jgi:hypothetical protein
LPESVLSGDPCTDALTSAQVKDAFGIVVPGKPDNTAATGPFCQWFNPNTAGNISVAYVTKSHNGLSGVYQNTRPQSKTWEELAIDGFPAVAHDKSANNCQISVGLADDLSIDVSGTLGNDSRGTVDPCQSTQKAATAVVTTLKQKAGA